MFKVTDELTKLANVYKFSADSDLVNNVSSDPRKEITSIVWTEIRIMHIVYYHFLVAGTNVGSNNLIFQ